MVLVRALFTKGKNLPEHKPHWPRRVHRKNKSLQILRRSASTTDSVTSDFSLTRLQGTGDENVMDVFQISTDVTLWALFLSDSAQRLVSESAIYLKKKSRNSCDTVIRNWGKDAATSDIAVRIVAVHALLDELVGFEEGANINIGALKVGFRIQRAHQPARFRKFQSCEIPDLWNSKLVKNVSLLCNKSPRCHKQSSPHIPWVPRCLLRPIVKKKKHLN